MQDKAYQGTIRRQSILALTLAFAGASLCLFFASRAEAATLTVCASGCTHTTIQDAVTAAADGDTVQVAAGTYNETVTLPASRTGLTLTGSDPANRPLVTGGVSFGAGMVNLTLRNLHVRRSSGTAVMNGGSLNGLTMDNVKVQGDNVPCDPAPAPPGTGCQHGIAGPQINGAVDVHDSQFVDIRSWSVFDTRSGSGGGYDRSPVDDIQLL